MSDTPRTDSECKEIHGDAYMRSVPDHGDYVDADFARQLERELNEAKHRIRTLIEERDSALTLAQRKWVLRDQFNAVLGTLDIETGIERVKEAQKGAARYEYVRKLTIHQYGALIRDCMTWDLKFDEEVDRRINEK